MGDRQNYISVPGGKVWYSISGSTTNGSPLIIIHGGPGASHDYLAPLEELSDERPVVFYDQLGCGNSDRPSDSSLWTVSRYVEELSVVVESFGFSEFNLLGQSWGCALAIEYCLTKRPKALKSLILSAPLISSPIWAEDQKRYVSLLPTSLRDIIVKCEEEMNYSNDEYQSAMMEFYRRHLCRMDEWPECMSLTFEKMNQEIYGFMWGPSEFTINGTLSDFDRTARLGEINVPTLLTAGEFDEAAPTSVRHFASLIPNSRVEIFAGASHSHHLESQESYLSVVRKFLKESNQCR